MHTLKSLQNDLQKMGLKPTDKILIHSSMKSIGNVEGNADTVIDSLIDYFKEGLLILPTHSWATMNAENTFFDVLEHGSCVGILTNIFRKREGVIRSLHPTHSLAAIGATANEYLEGQEDTLTPASPKGSYAALMNIDAKILLLGCNLGQNTFIHAIEEIMDVPDRIAKDPILFQLKNAKGEIIERNFHKHHTSFQNHLSLNYNRAENLLAKEGIITYHNYGDARCLLMDAKKLGQYLIKLLEKDLQIFDKAEPSL